MDRAATDRRLGDVTGSMPARFAAYVRILHPVDDGDQAQTWAEIAAEVGKIVYPMVTCLTTGLKGRPRAAHPPRPSFHRFSAVEEDHCCR